MTKNDETETFKTKVLKTGIVKHPRYYNRRSAGTIKFDIALLELEVPVDFLHYHQIR